MLEIIIAFLLSTFSATYLTNPFAKFSIVRLPYRAKLSKQTKQIINHNHRLIVRTSPLWKLFAWYQCGLYILSTRYVHQASSKSDTVESIIKDIHTLRFNPEKLLLISGDHFNGLFVRNLGVFYYPMLDGNIFYDEADWHNRQEVYLQTVAFALGSFAKSPILKTTIIPTGRYATTNINFYSYPSDSLFGILYALATLVGVEDAGASLYRQSSRSVDTTPAANELLKEYAGLLTQLYAEYHATVFDDESLLIKKGFHMSGAKDITKRSSAFYDNVVHWKTTQLAMKLGVIDTDLDLLERYKQSILSTYWLEKEGYFLEDLSSEGLAQKNYSSDWLIVLSTGFLDTSSSDERAYYERSIEYIRKHKIARPFAIKYQNETRAHRQFLAVRLAVASYGGDSIWSFWGMEYIKVNLRLYVQTGDRAYLKEADYHIEKYKKNIITFKGFPEVYDTNGDMLQTRFYKSIRMTGWVIGFEQVLVMRETIPTA